MKRLGLIAAVLAAFFVSAPADAQFAYDSGGNIKVSCVSGCGTISSLPYNMTLTQTTVASSALGIVGFDGTHAEPLAVDTGGLAEIHGLTFSGANLEVVESNSATIVSDLATLTTNLGTLHYTGTALIVATPAPAPTLPGGTAVAVSGVSGANSNALLTYVCGSTGLTCLDIHGAGTVATNAVTATVVGSLGFAPAITSAGVTPVTTPPPNATPPPAPTSSPGNGGNGAVAAAHYAQNSSGLMFPTMCDTWVVTSAVITATTTLVLAAPGAGIDRYVCGVFLTPTGTNTTGTGQLEVGTQTTNPCDTGAAIFGPFLSVPGAGTSAPTQFVNPWAFETTAANVQICVVSTGTVNYKVSMWYASHTPS